MNDNIRPKLSVAIKTYNHAPYVSECIESVLSQSFRDFELIITDDASTDETPDILKEFTDPRIKLEVLTRNIGISGAMNHTIARSEGEYIAILNSDDVALPNRFAEQVEYLDCHPDVDAIFGTPLLIAENGELSGAEWNYRVPSVQSRIAWLRHFFIYCNCLCAPTAMIRRTSYEKAGQYDQRLTNLQDLDMWVRFLLEGQNIRLLPSSFTAFRIRDNNRNASGPTKANRLRTQFEFSKILRKFLGLESALLLQIFAPDISSGRVIVAGKSPDIWLSELALDVGSPAHRLFALETLFETAKEFDDFQRLRDAMGSTDIFGLLRTEDRHLRMAYLKRIIAKIRKRGKRFSLRKNRALLWYRASAEPTK